MDCGQPGSMGFSWKEYWSRLLSPSPGDLPGPGMEPESPALAGGVFTIGSPGNTTPPPTILFYLIK